MQVVLNKPDRQPFKAIHISKAERVVFKRKKRIKPSLFAEQSIILPMSSIPGRWKNSNAPYLAGILDASFFPSVRKIVICAAQQTGKSEIANVALAYAQRMMPGPAMYVYPDEQTAKDNSKDRVLPLYKSSPGLKRLFTGFSDDESINRIKLINSVIYFAWATSPAKTANKPIKYMIMDELDMYPATIDKRRGAPHKEAEARTRTYSRTRKIWYISSPTNEKGVIWQLYQEAQARFKYHVCCPECGTYQVIERIKQIKWPDVKENNLKPDDIEAQQLAYYPCQECGAKWNDLVRNRAVLHGYWAEEETGTELFKYLRKHRPIYIAVHIPAFISKFVSLSEAATNFLKSKDDPIKLRTFTNYFEARPWKFVVTKTKRSEILRAKTGLPPQVVPQGAVALFASIDSQISGFWFVVRAWYPDFTSNLIHYGPLSSFQDLEHLLFETYYPVMETDATMSISRACIDTGGGKQQDVSITEEVYNWVRSNYIGPNGCRVWAIKGASMRMPGKVRVGKPLDRMPSGKPIPGGLQIIQLDTAKLKELFMLRLQKAIRHERGGAYLHRDTTAEYVSHVTAEEKRINENGKEEWVQTRKANHLFDCEVYNQALADPEWPIGGVNLITQPVGLYDKQQSQTQETQEMSQNAMLHKKTTERSSRLW